MNNKIISSILGIVAATVFCFTGCSAGFSYFNYTYENGDKYTAGDREITDKITSVNIDYGAGNVKFSGSDTDKVSIRETANKDLTEEQKVHTWVDGNTLYVRYCASTKRISFYKIQKELEITVPGAQDLSELVVKVSAGNMDFDGFKTDKLNVESSAGNVSFSCSAKEAAIKVTSGNIRFEENGDAKLIDINSTSGNIKVNQKGSLESVKIHATSGDIDAVFDSVSACDIRSTAGNRSIEAESIVDFKSQSTSGNNKFKFCKAPKTADIKSSSGNVYVYLPEDCDVTFHPKITSGEFDYKLTLTKNGKDYVNGNGTNDMIISVTSGNITLYSLLDD